MRFLSEWLSIEIKNKFVCKLIFLLMNVIFIALVLGFLSLNLYFVYLIIFVGLPNLVSFMMDITPANEGFMRLFKEFQINATVVVGILSALLTALIGWFKYLNNKENERFQNLVDKVHSGDINSAINAIQSLPLIAIRKKERLFERYQFFGYLKSFIEGFFNIITIHMYGKHSTLAKYCDRKRFAKYLPTIAKFLKIDPDLSEEEINRQIHIHTYNREHPYLQETVSILINVLRIQTFENKLTVECNTNYKLTKSVIAALSAINQETKKGEISAVNLSGADLPGINLEGIDFSGANMEGIILSEADLLGANFTGATLQGAKLREANLQGADLSKANLQEALLENTNLQGASLFGTNLQGAVLYKANLQESSLYKADLQRAKLSEANLQEANLVESNLQGAKLSETNLQGANLVMTNLQGASLFGTNLKGACLRLVKNLTFEQLEGAIIDIRTILPDNIENRTEELLKISEENFNRLKNSEYKPAWVDDAYPEF